jgi:protoheme IX farnesyltransferase
MMPNVKGADHTRLEILVYSLILAPFALLPWLMGFASLAYGILASSLGLVFVVLAWRVFRIRSGEQAERCPKVLFGFSILYLFLLFAEIVAERVFDWCVKIWA